VLTDTVIDSILRQVPHLTLGVLGDLFLDRYLDIDASLTEPSIETGLDAYQVVRVRPSPGAAGTVINNLAALGVGRILPISVIGDDGEGYELRQALDHLGVVDRAAVFIHASRRTPTYTKPMLHEAGKPPRELNRLDIKNHSLLAADAETQILDALAKAWPAVDALLVLDQVDEKGYGVVTPRIVQCLAELGESDPAKLILADSRECIGMFRSVWLKPNESECIRSSGSRSGDVEAGTMKLAQQAGRPVFCTCGARGILLVDPRPEIKQQTWVPAYPVAGPLDIVGAGDSTSAGIACSLAAGANLQEAAAFGNLVASITIQQIGTTGTATPGQVRRRWHEVSQQAAGSRHLHT
jgi:bifunctional ADP-heptose synthase (sugar kinase/adenylyltransferase)